MRRAERGTTILPPKSARIRTLISRQKILVSTVKKKGKVAQPSPLPRPAGGSAAQALRAGRRFGDGEPHARTPAPPPPNWHGQPCQIKRLPRSPEPGLQRDEPASAASPVASVATLARFSGRVVVLALRFLRMAEAGAPAIERLGLLEWNLRARVNKGEMLAIWLPLVKLIGLVADRVASPAFQAMAVVVEYFLEWSEIEDGLIALEARTLFAFERLQRHRVKLDSLDCAP